MFVKNGDKKLLEECSLPLTGARCVDLVITDKAVFEVDKKNGLTLIEIAEGLTLEQLRAVTGCEYIVRAFSLEVFFLYYKIFRRYRKT
jgi:acyl CoA:acetate/3-ketoacid CoA transferase beta subunit